VAGGARQPLGVNRWRTIPGGFSAAHGRRPGDRGGRPVLSPTARAALGEAVMLAMVPPAGRALSSGQPRPRTASRFLFEPVRPALGGGDPAGIGGGFTIGPLSHTPVMRSGAVLLRLPPTMLSRLPAWARQAAPEAATGIRALMGRRGAQLGWPPALPVIVRPSPATRRPPGRCWIALGYWLCWANRHRPVRGRPPAIVLYMLVKGALVPAAEPCSSPRPAPLAATRRRAAGLQ